MKKLNLMLLALILFAGLLLVSCGEAVTDRLGYQKSAFTVKADITVGELKLPVIIVSSPVDTEEAERRVSLTIDGGIISGVGFEFNGENVCLISGELRIPIAEPDLLCGVSDIISLFSIGEDSFCGESETTEGMLMTFSENEGAKKYEVLVSDSLPKRITATLGERVIIAEINEFLPE